MWSFELINDRWFPIFKIIQNQKIANLIFLKTNQNQRTVGPSLFENL